MTITFAIGSIIFLAVLASPIIIIFLFYDGR